MNLYFVRHGETTQNQNKCYYGSIDVDLTKKGVEQAKNASKLLENVNFDTVYTSERKRARQTARIIMEDKASKFIVDNRINETNFGDFEGKSYEKLKELYPKEWEDWCNDWKNISPPKGESYKQFYSRVKSFMDDILKLEAENVLIATHGGVIRSIYCYVLENNLDYFWKFGSKNGDITIVKYEYGNLYIDSISHVSV